MTENVPIKFSEFFKLPSLGIPQQSVNFASVTLESDKFVCIRHEDPKNQDKMISIVEVDTQTTSSHKINAESAIMNPKSKVVALRASNQLQIINLEMKSKMKDYVFKGETVVYWKWISVKTVAITTDKSVYHWSMEGSSTPQKVFDRHDNLSNSTIINYKTDKSEQWLLLVGIEKVDGEPKGRMQLFSVERNVTQYIEGHAASFLEFPVQGGKTATVVAITSSSSKDGGKLFVMEVPSKTATGLFQKKTAEVEYAHGDFPVSMQANEKLGIIYIVSRQGVLYLFDVESATLIYSTRVSSEAIFVTAPHESTNGFIGVNNKIGQVLSISVDENKIIPFLNSMGQQGLAIAIASRGGIEDSSISELFQKQFMNLLNQNRLQDAIKLASTSPNGILRTPQALDMIQRVPVPQGSKPAISVYFSYIIENGKLNKYESVELAKIVLQKQGGSAYIKQLLEQDKIEANEELGNIMGNFDSDLQTQIYLKGSCHEKIIEKLLFQGDFKKVLLYCEKVSFEPNYLDIFKKLSQAQPDSAVEFAVEQYNKEKLNANFVVDIFVQQNQFRQATAFFLDILKGDKEEDGALQTRLLEINLIYSPINVTDQILSQGLYSHYDKNYIAQLCEKVSLFHRALENYISMDDKKRVISNAQFMDPEWLVNYIGTLEVEDEMILLNHLMKINARQNFNIVVQVGTKNVEKLGTENMINLFEEHKSYPGLFYFLGGIVDYSEDPDVHFKYIEASVKLEQWSEVERVTRQSNFYDPEKTKEFLKEVKLSDLMPLVNVCDKYDYIDELVRYLKSNNALKYIDMYVKQRPLKTPFVIGSLLEVDASEDFIKGILQNVGPMCPIEPLVTEVEKRNRLKTLINWLEARANEGTTEPAAYNALAKVYIDTHNQPDKFLETNEYYDKLLIGKYCEKRDPNLSFIAYKKGLCDKELVDVTNKNSMFKQQARYLVKRQNLDIWTYVLTDENEYKRNLIDAVIQTALQETNNADEVSVTVKAFMAADLPNELIELLEKIVLHGSTEFRSNKNLQNLLILTAIKADQSKVMNFINRLDNYDGEDIAKIAITSELFEEGFEIYKKTNLNSKAISVLLNNIQDLSRAQLFAEKVNEPEVWSLLGVSQLSNNLCAKAIESFLKANDPTHYHDVIAASEATGDYEELIQFLKMTRKKIQDSHIDTELIYAYAQLDKKKPQSSGLADLEEFISGSNMAKIQNVAERCFEEELYEASKILFISINNYSYLASTLVKLNKLREAVIAATKANTPKSWKEVLKACVDAQDFKNAQTCGLNLIIDTDELENLIDYYESSGYFEQLVNLLEKGVGLEDAHMGIYTALGTVYAKYSNEKLMDLIQQNYKRINIPKLLITCSQNGLYAEMRFLYMHNDEYDSAVKIMMDYPIESFDSTLFLDAIAKSISNDLIYKSIQYFVKEHPQKLNDLLSTISSRVDQERITQDAKNGHYLPLIKKYLESIQEVNLPKVNEGLNSIYCEEEDFEALRESITQYQNFDQISLATSLKDNELLEFRRIAAILFKLNKNPSSSIELSKKDKLYKDAIETASDSKDSKIAEDLLRFFVENNLKECFSACLYTCYDLIHPDVALELSWRFNIQDMSMPYLIQVLKEYTSKVDELYNDKKQLQKQLKQQEEQSSSFQGGNDQGDYYDTQPIGGGYGQSFVDPNMSYQQNTFDPNGATSFYQPPQGSFQQQQQPNSFQQQQGSFHQQQGNGSFHGQNDQNWF
eukprot:gene5416-9229_t